MLLMDYDNDVYYMVSIIPITFYTIKIQYLSIDYIL